MSRDCVVVIDDDPDLRELVGILLTGWGLTAIEATHCAEALPLLDRERGRIRAVLLDYFMPGLTPITCAEELRSRLEPDVPVVLLSAAADIAARARELGLTRYLAKPFDVSDLHDTLFEERQ